MDDIVNRLRAVDLWHIVMPNGNIHADGAPFEAADEIERLRAELAAEREWKRANIELAEQLVTVTAERDALSAELEVTRKERMDVIRERNALRAELAAERERADAHYRVLELVSAKRDELTAERDALRELLLDAYNTWGEWPQETLARIADFLNKRGVDARKDGDSDA